MRAWFGGRLAVSSVSAGGSAMIVVVVDRGSLPRRFPAVLACVALAGCAGTHQSGADAGQIGSGGTVGAAGAVGEDGGVIFRPYDGPPPSYDAVVDGPPRVVGGAPL